MRPRPGGRRTPLAGLLTLALAATLTGPAHAQPEPPPPDPPPAGVQASYAVTLVTGDRVLVDEYDSGRHAVTLAPAARPGFDGGFQTVEDGARLYVLPSDVVPLLDDVLDRHLFDVRALAAAGYTDGVPVISTYQPASGAGPVTTELGSIDAVAMTADPAGDWWRAVREAEPDSPTASGRVWLDQPVSVALAESGPLVGAPQAHQAGWDGAGVRVAVLDTGVDGDHPDLAGSVVAEENFTGSDTVGDRHGHGTHIAGTVAGSGAASDGALVGVAPGAELVNGKVLGDEGTGPASGIIAGMEWAVEQGADVVNLSLGGGSGDGGDPLSMAVDELTAAHDTLFVVAAGNSGPDDQSVAAPGTARAALTVGAVTKEEELAPASGRGPRPGDFGIKPDLTAPGVDIVAARAAGTEAGTPVDERYASLSGTSMATPHAAGAAAILRQAEPELTAEAVKARLSNTAVPHPDLDVYEQGGGRLDVPAALGSRVHAEPAQVDFGLRRFPHDDAAPEATSVTYRNRAAEPITVDLSLAVTSRDGVSPETGMLSVTPGQLTLAPGEAGEATVVLDTRVGAEGLYSGYLVAAPDGGGEAYRTPVGFFKEPERYDLTISGIARDGRPAAGASSVAVLDEVELSRFMRPAVGLTDGQARLRVPPGTYSVLGTVHTYDAHDELVQHSTFVGATDVAVAGDVEVVLDAREGNEFAVDPPDDRPTAAQGQVGFGYWRTGVQPGPPLGVSIFGMHPDQGFSAQPLGPPERGGFEFYSHWRMGAPEAELSVAEPAAVTLDPALFQPPAVAGPQRVPLVDAGTGTAEEIGAADAAGAAVLTGRGEVPIPEQEEHAAAAGAAALVVSNDVPGPLVGPPADPGTVPVLTVSESEGDELRSLLDGGAVTVELDGTRWSPYLYDLVLLEVDGIPEQLAYQPEPGELAELDVHYHNDVDGHPMGEARHFSRPFHSSSALLYPHIEGPRERTEYVVAGDALSYQQTFYGELPFEAQLREPEHRFYQPGAEPEVTAFRQVVRPAVVPAAGLTTRTADTLHLQVYEWVDAAGNHFPDVFGLSPYPGDTVVTRVSRDGELVAETGRPQGDFPMVEASADYEIALEAARDAPWWERSVATRTEWRFRSQSPPGPDPAPLPLLTVDYLLDLDLANVLRTPVLELRVTSQAPDLPSVEAAEVSVSYDDGASWEQQPVTPLGDGGFQVALPEPPAGHTGFGSVQVLATDTAGNQVEQEVVRAWRLP